MSASREKWKRKQQLEENGGVLPDKSSSLGFTKGQKIATIVVVLVIALLTTGVFIVNSGWVQRHTTAVTIGDQKVSVAEYNFHFYSSVSSYVNYLDNYGLSASDMGLDTSAPLNSQIYDESTGQTWADYFKDQATSSVHEVYAFYSKAMQAGYVLSDDVAQSIDDSVEQLKSYCDDNDISLTTYLTETYGSGMNESVFRNALTVANISYYYSQSVQDGYSFTDQECEDQYEANKIDYDLIDYRTYTFSGTVEAADEETAVTDEEQQAATDAAMTKAQIMLSSITDEASFNDLAKAYAMTSGGDADTYDDPDATLVTAAQSSNMLADISDWMYDESRIYADKTVIQSGNDAIVLYFIDRYRDDSLTVDVRHILIQPEDAEDEESVAAAQEKAQGIYDQWLAGDATEDSFAALAETYSEDDGSIANGGLYEQVYQNEMVAEFNDWCFDPARQPGDNDIVQTDYGFHIMYFIGTDDPYWQVQVSSDLSSQSFDEYYSQLLEDYPLVEKRVPSDF